MRRAYVPLVLALLTVPTCASLPAFAPRDGTTVAAVELPPFPKAVPSMHGPVAVVLVHHLHCGGETAFGCYHYRPRMIEIEDTLSPVRRWRYLRHEVVHLALDVAGATLVDREAENLIAEAMADQQLNEMVMRWPR